MVCRYISRSRTESWLWWSYLTCRCNSPPRARPTLWIGYPHIFYFFSTASTWEQVHRRISYPRLIFSIGLAWSKSNWDTLGGGGSAVHMLLTKQPSCSAESWVILCRLDHGGRHLRPRKECRTLSRAATADSFWKCHSWPAVGPIRPRESSLNVEYVIRFLVEFSSITEPLCNNGVRSTRSWHVGGEPGLGYESWSIPLTIRLRWEVTGWRVLVCTHNTTVCTNRHIPDS